MENILNKIRDFADNAHGSQMRKYTPERYIAHPIRVMETCKKYDTNVILLSEALLHDVLEKTQVTRDEMEIFLQSVMVEATAGKTLSVVIELTDVYTEEAYPQWSREKRKQKEHERIAHISPTAQTVKYADMIDNSNDRTLHNPAFAQPYLNECLDTLKMARDGNPELHAIAFIKVQQCLKQLKENH